MHNDVAMVHKDEELQEGMIATIAATHESVKFSWRAFGIKFIWLKASLRLCQTNHLDKRHLTFTYCG